MNVTKIFSLATAFWVCLFGARVAICQYPTPQETLDQSIWYREPLTAGAVSNDGDIVFSRARISLSDGRNVHASRITGGAFSFGSISPDCKSGLLFETVDVHWVPYPNVTLVKLDDGFILGQFSALGSLGAMFAPDSTFYHWFSNLIFADRVLWMDFSKSSNYFGVIGFESNGSIIRIYEAVNSQVFLNRYDVKTKTLLSHELVGPERVGSYNISYYFGKNNVIVRESLSKLVVRQLHTWQVIREVTIPAELSPQNGLGMLIFPENDDWVVLQPNYGKAHILDLLSGKVVDLPWLNSADSFAISPDGKKCLTAITADEINDGKRYLQVRDVHTGEISSTIAGYGGPEGFAAVSDPNLLATSTDMLDAESGKILSSKGASYMGLPALLSPNGKFIVNEFWKDGLWHKFVSSTFGYGERHPMPVEFGSPRAWLGDSENVVCANATNDSKTNVTVWNFKTGNVTCKLSINRSVLQGVSGAEAILRLTNELVYFDKNLKAILFVNLLTGAINRSITVSDQVYGASVVASQDGAFIVIGAYTSWDGARFKMYSTADLQPMDTVSTDERATIRHISFDGRYVFGYLTFSDSYADFLYDTKVHKDIFQDHTAPTALEMQIKPQYINSGECAFVRGSSNPGLFLMRMNNSFGGVVNVPGRAGSKAEMPAQVNVYDSTGSLKKSRQTMLGNYGRFTAGLPLADGNYSLWIKPKGCLAAKASFVMPVGLKDWLPVRCIPGDCNGDNKVDSTDVDALSNAFDTSEGDEGFSADCELTGDHYVGTDDYLLIGANLGRVGAALP